MRTRIQMQTILFQEPFGLKETDSVSIVCAVSSVIARERVVISQCTFFSLRRHSIAMECRAASE